MLTLARIALKVHIQLCRMIPANSVKLVTFATVAPTCNTPWFTLLNMERSVLKDSTVRLVPT